MIVLTAVPQIVAKQNTARNGATQWAWTVSNDDREAITAAVRDGKAGTFQERDPHGVTWLMAFDVAAQREAAIQAAKARALVAANARRRERGQPVIVRKPAARPIGGKTIVPYMYDAARW